MDEHHWKFKVGSKHYDQYWAVIGKGFDYARVEVLCAGEWDVFVGQPVAEEMLRLAAENAGLRAELRRFYNGAVEAYHDLSVKLELAETRVRELEERLTAVEAPPLTYRLP